MQQKVLAFSSTSKSTVNVQMKLTWVRWSGLMLLFNLSPEKWPSAGKKCGNWHQWHD